MKNIKATQTPRYIWEPKWEGGPPMDELAPFFLRGEACLLCCEITAGDDNRMELH
jgi:hypothetical protein